MPFNRWHGAFFADSRTAFQTGMENDLFILDQGMLSLV